MEKERFTVRFAVTDEEKNAAYALRFNDMLLEYRQDASAQNGLDITEYDAYARQIICIDNETNEVVGCYRIITSDDLPADKAFISEEEFTLDTLKKTGERIAELSRAVVKKEYRNSVVLMLLLRFIVKYIREQNYRFIIGDASFFGTDKKEYVKELSYLAEFSGIDPAYGVKSLEKEQVELLPVAAYEPKEVKHSLPALIRAYYSFGAKFSCESFTDWEFGSVDVFVLLDTQNYNVSYINRVLRL
ncbi:MAG: GNAT family N-acetyltransferase [Clostridia bacterium]|nr:GNAT family N-acetyltransferase [Clostridia bacterium]